MVADQHSGAAFAPWLHGTLQGVLAPLFVQKKEGAVRVISPKSGSLAGTSHMTLKTCNNMHLISHS